MKVLIPTAMAAVVIVTPLSSPAPPAFSGAVAAQTGIPERSRDNEGAPPRNPFAADSPWPQFHRNAYAQGSTPYPGPTASDAIDVQFVPLPREFRRGGAPTQMHLSESYPDGSRTAWSTNLFGVVKARIKGDTFEWASGYKMANRVFGGTVPWNMQLGAGNMAFVPDTRQRAILKVGDVNPSDPMSELELKAQFSLPDAIPGKPTTLNLTFDGWVVFATDEGWLGAVRNDFSEHRSFDLATATGDTTTHNSFPIDENGNIYIVSDTAMYQIRWNNEAFSIGWSAPYDFLGPGCKAGGNDQAQLLRVVTGGRCTGSGTTPTLVGTGSMDRLVIAVDSHRQNQLVAFWRDEIPANWRGLPGRDRRIAAVYRLPHATWAGKGYSVENSPSVAGYDVTLGQYAGFFADCESPRGVQMIRWNPRERRFGTAWTRPEVSFNNVITTSTATNLVYGIGRDDTCNLVYRGLDRRTGRSAFDITLGKGNRFVDGGNSHVVNDDRSIIYGSGTGFVRLHISGDN
ncbi:MAG: hypothetical protein AAF249_11485 [Pseudomonadota bacterium]